MISTLLLSLAIVALVPKAADALIPKNVDLPALIRRALGRPPTRAKALSRPGELLGVLVLFLTLIAIHLLVDPGMFALGIGVGAGVLWLVWERFFPSARALVSRWVTLIAVLTSTVLMQTVEGQGASTLVGIWGIVLLSTIPANDLVSAVLVLVKKESSEAVAGGSETGSLKGGRWIGPLERLLIIVLAGIDANVAVGTMIAAKGIIRFPEISKDETGEKAEEFLIGSLVSWAFAVLAAMMMRRL